MSPLVSIIIPCYNCQETIEDTLQSVLSSTLDRSSFEVIAVNDCSCDSTAEILNKYADKITIIHKLTNDGPSKTRNSGIAAAKGEYIAFCDSDDLWEPEKLNKQLVRFCDPEIGLVCTDVDIFYGQQLILPKMSALRPLRSGDVFTSLLESNFIVTSSVMARKSALMNVGGFDGELWFSEDLDLWLKIAQKWKIDSIDEVLVHYRESENSLSKSVLKMYDSKIKVLTRATIGLDKITRNNILSKCYYRQGCNLFHERKFQLARERLQMAIMARPGFVAQYIYFLLTFLPPNLVNRLATVKNQLFSS